MRADLELVRLLGGAFARISIGKEKRGDRLHVSDFTWTRESYPVEEFLSRRLAIESPNTRASWHQFYDREEEDLDPGYMRELKNAWLSDSDAGGRSNQFDPVIFAELEDGSIDVGDGWHRIAASITRNRAHLRALVGRLTRGRRR